MRPRKTDRHLPSSVYLRHGAYYLVQKGKWIRLGKTLKEALSEYAKRKEPEDSELMPALMARWLNQIKIAPSTMRTYRLGVKKLSKILAEFRPRDVTARDIMTILHHHKETPAMANQLRAVLVGSLEYAFVEQLVDRNVARDTKSLKQVKRDRYLTDQEYRVIYEQASPTLKAIMDIAYITGQRVGDVLKITYADLTETGISVIQQKTKKRMTVEWSDELRAAVESAKKLHQCVKAFSLFHTHKGTAFTYWNFRQHWVRAIEGTGIENIHFHDIRAKAGTDAKSQGLDSQTLLGHESERTHKIYLRSKEIPVATPVSIGHVQNKKTS